LLNGIFAAMPELSKAKLQSFIGLRTPEGRREAGLFLTEGVKLLYEGLSAGWIPQAVVGRPDVLDALRLPAWPLATEVYEADSRTLERLSTQESPEGLIAIFRLPPEIPPVRLSEHVPAFLAWKLNDPGNLGTLIRIADWFGFQAVLTVPGTASPWNTKTIRASMGSIFRVPVIALTDVTAFVQHAAHRLVVAALTGDALSAQVPDSSDILVIGNETHGSGELLASHPNLRTVTIPRLGHAESLNAGVAAGILAHHWAIQVPKAAR
jgi:TrmH family RNA methyltransferase